MPSAASGNPSVEELLAFERMLVDLSARMANVPVDRVEAEVQIAQGALQQFLGFDRSTFAEFKDDGSLAVLSSTALEGIDATPPGPLPAKLGWFIAKLRAGETLIIQDPAEDLPPEAVGEAEYVQRTGLRSHLSIPLRVGGRVVGAIAFSAFRETRNWPDDLIARVKLVGEVFAHAIARKREHEKLLAAMVEIGLLKDRLERENSYLKQAVQVMLPQGLTSRSPRFLSVVEEIKQVAQTSSTVLLLGETGSGKEVLAQAIHDASAQRGRTMVKVNCAALPASLIESELFGREKGAFTGALARQAGRFEIADGSTIFLDEVGELPLELQPKLLRVLQEGEFERLGGSKTIKVDARVIAATNRSLEQAVKEGKFREDLFYRLNVFPIEVPPLRERRDDIPFLTWTFVKEFGNSMGKPIEEIAEESMSALRDYHWPGNIRELRNVIERAMILSHGPKLYIKLSNATLRPVAVKITAGSLDEAELTIIRQAVEQCNWRIRGANGAAALLKMKPTTLESRIKRLGLAPRR
ncbi:sigma 54-interacting transcriptional regulator [Bradyrhizobium quebecense]|uniref:Sigma 54-interacting transcriptional regulator n=1 Tax=Bradyrhizobium quebecense TaxID=2748629 RepID=A0A973WX14_9BRAD|nr:sigma 54-interacting transcriptional regulator [Bradyrhizobium quebecense]UGA43956.1 sigma 54-interacting transcriptional regulator [Bradyrhizobium quebecense]